MDDAAPADGLTRFLTLADTAELLAISANQAYALVRSGELPAIKVGSSRQWRVERSVLESYIEAMYEETRRMSSRLAIGRHIRAFETPLAITFRLFPVEC